MRTLKKVYISKSVLLSFVLAYSLSSFAGKPTCIDSLLNSHFQNGGLTLSPQTSQAIESVVKNVEKSLPIRNSNTILLLQRESEQVLTPIEYAENYLKLLQSKVEVLSSAEFTNSQVEKQFIEIYSERINHLFSVAKRKLSEARSDKKFMQNEFKKTSNYIGGLLDQIIGELGELKAAAKVSNITAVNIIVEDLLTVEQEALLKSNGLYDSISKLEIDIVYDGGNSWGEVKYLGHGFGSQKFWTEKIGNKMHNLAQAQMLLNTQGNTISNHLIMVGPGDSTVEFYDRLENDGIKVIDKR